MDKNLLGKFNLQNNLLDPFLPPPQQAPPNIYGESQ